MHKLQDLYVRDVMTTGVVTIGEEEAITKAADKMLKSKIHGLVVLDGSRPSGLISTFDLLKIVFLKEYSETMSVRNYSSKRTLITTGPDTSLLEAADLMVRNNIRTLPVVAGERLVGIVSMMDIMKKAIG